eukprot:CAMPEP_0181341754 /NCGR_PEP_ID=MMETSP1101-20121128/30599_1 /TAXON_ID=46948 /ORGANISM="Rhodomonas abbreviata, Strain Caron Lab Isolate" /LENGTH=144 /DNA_ID=CAMNT_0023453093 /DNA_START=24 /DNA_END=455 /DNA_ORIENTATION=-
MAASPVVLSQEPPARMTAASKLAAEPVQAGGSSSRIEATFESRHRAKVQRLVLSLWTRYAQLRHRLCWIASKIEKRALHGSCSAVMGQWVDTMHSNRRKERWVISLMARSRSAELRLAFDAFHDACQARYEAMAQKLRTMAASP